MMFNLMRKKKKTDEAGQALILVLVLLVLGSLFLTALLGFIGTGAKTGSIYDKKAAELYAADAGIQDATWQIRTKKLEDNFPTYSRYDFGATGWSYSIPPVNNEPVTVTIRNMWIPSNIPTPTDVATPQGIITAGKLIVAGNTILPGVTADDGSTKIFQYEIKIAYTPGTSENLTVDSIGIWLPPGFTYFTDTNHTCSLQSLSSPYQSTMVELPWAGNKTWVWSFGSTPSFNSFPGHSGTPPAQVTISVTLYFKPPQDQPTLKPDAVAWIKTSGVGDIPYSWDASTTIYKSTSLAQKPVDVGTTIDSYMTHSELPQLQTAQAGDYVAMGKTLMLGVDPRSNRRELLLPDSTNTIDSVPTNANVELAYLYWAGWLKQPLVGAEPSVGIFWDNGNSLNNWTAGSSWTSSGTSATDFNGRFVGHYSSGGEPAKYLTLTNPVNLYDNNPVNNTPLNLTSATIQWEQEVSTAITFRAAGTVASGTTGGITPGLPSGLVNNDMCVLVASTIAGGSITITTPVSITWNAMPNSPINVANGEELYVWWGRYSSGNTAPTLTPGSNHSIARIAAYYNVDTSASPIDVSAVGTETTSDTSFSFATGLTTSQNNEKVIIVCTSGYDNNTAQFSNAFSNANLTSITTRLNNETSSGGGGGFGLADGTLSTAGAVGTWAETLANASTKAYICFAFKPISDTLRLSISNNGGSSYNDVGSYSSSGSYSYNLSSAYFVSNFKMRFYIDGFDGAGEYVYLDNIGIMVTSAAITDKPADTTVTFSINNGTPHTITADPTDPAQAQYQVKDGPPSAEPLDGYYYGCRMDVTDFIKEESNGADPDTFLTSDPVYGNGNGEYKVAGVYADSLKADGTTYGSASFAGWSLVIIYSSPETLGHQLYLYDLKDTFQSVPATVPDSPPMQISGFIVPQRIGLETEVAKLTMFVGEGDIQISINPPLNIGDYIAIVDQRNPTEHLLWDGVDLPADNNTQGSPRNVWNGRSTGSSASEAGVDIDTFHVLWTDNILLQGDTSAQLNMHTNGDGYVTIYKILSFRSKITTGGSINYLIH